MRDLRFSISDCRFFVLSVLICVHLRLMKLKKQSQFSRGENEYKYLNHKVLCKFMPFWTAKKQSQFHALKSKKGQVKIERST